MNDDRDIELIEQYLQNQLPENERRALEERLQQQEGLAVEFERRRTAHHLLDLLIAQDLKEQLRAQETEEARVIPLRSRRSIWVYGLSAAAAVLLLIGVFTLVFPGETRPAELAAAFYEEPVFSTQRSGEPTGEEAAGLTAATEALERRAYDEAVNILVSVSAADEDYIPANYLLGHAYYLSSRFDLAENSFKVVISGNDMRYRERAEWYALLACLRQAGAGCRESLNRIAADNSHSYHDQALKIQRRLK